MSKYTVELRYICESSIGNKKAGGYNKVSDIIREAMPKIFDFDYPIFDEAYRSVLQTKIIKHYYTREIGQESYGLWKLRLDTKLNEIMPYYNQLYKSELLEFNPLYNFNITRDHNTQFDSKRTTGNDVSSSTSNTTSNTLHSTDAYSDTPQGSLYSVESQAYLTNARVINNTDSGNSTSSINTNSNGDDDFNSTEDYLEHVYGYEGKDASELLLKYRQTFLNIDMQVIEELEELFFQLW